MIWLGQSLFTTLFIFSWLYLNYISNISSYVFLSLHSRIQFRQIYDYLRTWTLWSEFIFCVKFRLSNQVISTIITVTIDWIRKNILSLKIASCRIEQWCFLVILLKIISDLFFYKSWQIRKTPYFCSQICFVHVSCTLN